MEAVSNAIFQVADLGVKEAIGEAENKGRKLQLTMLLQIIKPGLVQKGIDWKQCRKSTQLNSDFYDLHLKV